MKISATIRLTSSFTLLFGLVAGILAISSYSLMSYEVNAKIDDALHIAIGATAMSAEHEFDEHPTQLGGEQDLQSVLSDTHSPSLSDIQIAVLEGLRPVAAKDGQRFGLKLLQPSEMASGHSEWGGARIAHETIALDKFHTKIDIYAAKSMRPALAQLARLRRTFMSLVPLSLALAAYLGYLIARRSLSPLSDLTRTIDDLSSSYLTGRVTVGQYDDEIGQLGARFNALLDRLETAFTLQRRFMADASHELRTPVAVALTAAQVATRPRERSLLDCEESLTVIEEQMLRLRRTIEDMFFLSQADVAALPITHEPTFLDDAVAEAARAAKTLAVAKQQTLRISALTEARCLGDQVLFKQAILILLDNAVKYTPRHGAIGIHLERSGGFWVCSVTDNGAGIALGSQARIFERFYRDHQPGDEKISGSGLGLSIAKSIVEAHRGTLTLAESRPGFTCFNLSLPVFESEDQS